MEKSEKFKSIKEMQKDIFKKIKNIFLSLFTAFANSDEEIRKIESIKEEISEEENEDEEKEKDNIVQEKIMSSTMKIFKDKIDSNR